MITLGKTKYQKFEAIVVILLIIGFILFKYASSFLEDMDSNLMQDQPDIASVLKQEFPINDISITVSFGMIASWVYGSSIIDLPKKKREIQALNMANRMVEIYDDEIKSITMAFVSHDDDVTKTIGFNYELKNGQLIKVEK